MIVEQGARFGEKNRIFMLFKRFQNSKDRAREPCQDLFVGGIGATTYVMVAWWDPSAPFLMAAKPGWSVQPRSYIVKVIEPQ